MVHVRSDRIAELGAEDDEAFLTIQELNLLGDNEFPFTCGQLVNLAPPDNAALAQSSRRRRHHGEYGPRQRSDRLRQSSRRFKPQVESMEGAAFMYACMIHGLAHAQVRAVSNIVERRNRDAWKIADAIGSLGTTALGILEHA